MNNTVPGLVEILSTYPAYNIVGHVNPDGDCIGSGVALCQVLEHLGKDGFFIRNSQVADHFDYFFINITSVDLESCNYQLPLICVDCPVYSRVGKILLEKYESPFLVIDHHISNKKFGKYNIVAPYAASTTEVLMQLLERDKIHITANIAEALYLGLMTDTGRFSYNTSVNTFKYAYDLVSAGVNPNKICSIIYENNSIKRYRLLERFLNHMELFSNDRACLSYLSTADFMETGGSPLDTEGFVGYTRELHGILVGCYIEYHDNFVKCSMRSSNKELRLDLLASKLGGGGHACAAGFTSDVDTFSRNMLKEVIDAHISKFFINHG